MRSRRAIAWGLWGLAMALAATGGVLILLTPDAQLPDAWGFRGYWTVIAPLIGTPGLLIALRQPRNAIGWLLLIGTLSDGYGGFAQEYATYAVVVHPGALPGAAAIAWVSSWSFSVFGATLLFGVPQLFPTGRPLSERWAPLLWSAPLFVAFSFFVFGLRPGPLENAPFMDNPLAASGTLAGLRTALAAPLTAIVGTLALASGASAVVRFIRSRGVEREQLKWIALSAGLITTGMIGIIVSQPPGESNGSKAAQIFLILAFATLPLAIGVAMLRYRLYDIDLIINRAIVYGALTAVLAASYVALVVVSQGLLRPITSGSEIAVAASTLATVALIQPLRRRFQDAVDRRFYRARYDAAHTLDALTGRLRDEVDLAAVRADIVDVVGDTLAPQHASIWLRGERP